MELSIGREFIFNPSLERCKDPDVRNYIMELYKRHGFFRVARFDDKEVIGNFPVDDYIIQSFGIAMEGTSGPKLYRYVFVRSEHENEIIFI